MKLIDIEDYSNIDLIEEQEPQFLPCSITILEKEDEQQK